MRFPGLRLWPTDAADLPREEAVDKASDPLDWIKSSGNVPFLWHQICSSWGAAATHGGE